MRIKSIASTIIAVACLMLVSVTSAESNAIFDGAKKSMTNWELEAVAHLGVTQEMLAKHKYLRCVKLNNYWCLKDVGWNGSVGRDSDGHTAFLDGSMAARAVVRNFRTSYFKHGRKTAFQIMSVYAPPNDCIGSLAGTRKDGTCIQGKNPTEKYAIRVARGVSDNSDADLLLFYANGVANESNLVKFLQNMSSFEIGGLIVSSDTIKRGICLENSTCKK